MEGKLQHFFSEEVGCSQSLIASNVEGKSVEEQDAQAAGTG